MVIEVGTQKAAKMALPQDPNLMKDTCLMPAQPLTTL
jgi:hypothetical protein